jgi:hypothetical protein
VALSVENNKISGTVIASNLIDSTNNATSLVKLTATGDGKISASLDPATTGALETITKTTERVASINETINAYGIYALDANLGRDKYQLYNGVIKTAINDEATARAAADKVLEEAFKEYKESHDALYEAHEQAFEEYKEILLYEQPDIDITTPWQWLRENFPLFNWEPILNDSEDFIQYEAEAINTDDDDDGGKPHTTMLVSFIQE